MDPSSVAIVVAAYLVGSVDFGVIVPRLSGIDIYSRGSGNPGATNVLRTMGRKVAAMVMVGDLLKGMAAASVGSLVGGPVVGFAAGFAAVVGHCFPLWHRFRGGKGVATTGGMAVWLAPIVGIGLLAAWAAIAALTRRASIASLAVAAAFVPALVAAGQRGWSLVWAGAAVVLVGVRHQGNVRRLLRGAEPVIEAS